MLPESEPAFDQLYDEGTAAEKQFVSTGDPAALERALDCWLAMLVHPDFDSAPERNRRMVLNNAGKAFWFRYDKASHALEDLEQAFQYWSKALEMAPESSPDRAVYLNNIGGVFAKKYEAGEKLADLEAAVKACRDSVAIATGAQARVFRHNLGTRLFQLWRRTFEPALLEEAIDCESRAGMGGEQLSERLDLDARELLTTYPRTGDATVLREAVHAAERSVELTPPGFADLPFHLNNLAEGLHYRYLATGNLADLAGAVELWRRAEGLLPQNSPQRPQMLHNLGKGLYAQYLRHQDPAVLNEAIALFETAERLVPGKAAIRSTILNALGAGLQARYEATASLDDLHRIIQAWEEALELTPPGDPARPLRLDSLGVGLRTRFGTLREQADLDRAVDCLIEAVQLQPEGSPGRPGSFNNLANALSDRYTAFGDPADREAAEVAWRAAVRGGLRLHPDH